MTYSHGARPAMQGRDARSRRNCGYRTGRDLRGVMTGRLEGKVTFITGAGRGQGRAHAVKQASEGAKIIAIDICEDIESNPYPMSSWDDLQETKSLVEKVGSQCIAIKADVRKREQLADAV